MDSSLLYFFFVMIQRPPRSIRTDTSFPTRRSSDLLGQAVERQREGACLAGDVGDEGDGGAEVTQAAREGEHRAGQDAGQRQRQGDGQKDVEARGAQGADRKSTRLNSSH